MVETPAGRPPAATRNAFLDLIRGVAIVRVVAWHTYGYAWLSFLVASMPAMFFVAGSLMAGSLDHRPGPGVVYSRFRRLLIPFWAYGVFALVVMVAHAAVAGAAGESVTWRQAIFWIFPIWDAQGSDWGLTWWAVLWYLRCLTWLLLLSPVLHWLFKRFSIALLGVPLGLIFAFEYLERSGTHVKWQFDDLALFSLFWLLGFCYNGHLLDRIGQRARLAATVFFAVCAAAWVTTQDVPGTIVNASYPAHLFVGMAWLFGALAFEAPLTRFALLPAPAKVIAWINDRIFTIYLWHTVGLFAAYQILYRDERPAWLRELGALPIVLVVTFACMLAAGWIEDLAARRKLHLAPAPTTAPGSRGGRIGRRAALVMSAVATLGVLAVSASVAIDVTGGQSSSSARRVVSAIPPSGVGLRIRNERAVIVEAPPSRIEAPPAEGAKALTPSDLQDLLGTWTSELGLTGSVLSVRRADGFAWEGASGTDTAGVALTADYMFPTASVTKTFTAALVLRLVEAGVIGLDDRASDYVPGIAHSDAVTIRQLIQHTSGLMATDAVAADEALAAATEADLAFEPGMGFLYSSPGYFLLGLVIESIYDAPFTTVLHEQLLDPLHLDRSLMDEEVDPLGYSTHPSRSAFSTLGVVRTSGAQAHYQDLGSFEYRGVLWSSAGLRSTVGDLSRWALVLWDGHDVVSAQMQDQMTTFLDASYEYTGLATYPFCPCWYENGRFRGERWGHNGRTNVLEYDPRDRTAIAIYTSGTDLDERLIVAYDELSRRVRDLIRGKSFDAIQPEQTRPTGG